MFLIVKPQYGDKIHDALVAVQLEAKNSFPRSWQRWKTYHAIQEKNHNDSESLFLQQSVVERKRLFETFMKATYNLSDEFNRVRHIVADSCHEWNQLYFLYL